MKTLISAAAAAILALAASEAGAQERRDWYVAGSGTLSMLDDTEGTIANAPAPGSTVRTENSFETGYGWQVAVGRRVGRVRLEAELGYSRDEQDQYVAIVPPTGRIPADVTEETLRVMANAYLDLSDGRVRPYVGVGLGAADIDVRFVAPRAPLPNEPPRELINDSDRRFAYQLMAGVAVPLSDRLGLTAQYRWFDAGKLELKDARGEAATREHAGHHIDVGLRLAF